MTDTIRKMISIELMAIVFVLVSAPLLGFTLGVTYAMERLVVPNDRRTADLNIRVNENKPSQLWSQRKPTKRYRRNKAAQTKRDKSTLPSSPVLSSSPQSLQKTRILADEDDVSDMESLPPPVHGAVNNRNASQEDTVERQQSLHISTQDLSRQQAFIDQPCQLYSNGTKQAYCSPSMLSEDESIVHTDSSSGDSAIGMTFDSPPTLFPSDPPEEEANEPEAGPDEAVKQQTQHEDKQQHLDISIDGLAPNSDSSASSDRPEWAQEDFLYTAKPPGYFHPRLGFLQPPETQAFDSEPLGENLKEPLNSNPPEGPSENFFYAGPLSSFTPIPASSPTSHPPPPQPITTQESNQDLLSDLSPRNPLFHPSSGPHLVLQIRNIVSTIEDLVQLNAEHELALYSRSPQQRYLFLSRHQWFMERLCKLLEEEGRDIEDIEALSEMEANGTRLDEIRKAYCVALWDLVRVLLFVVVEKVGCRTAGASVVSDTSKVKGRRVVDSLRAVKDWRIRGLFLD